MVEDSNSWSQIRDFATSLEHIAPSVQKEDLKSLVAVVEPALKVLASREPPSRSSPLLAKVQAYEKISAGLKTIAQKINNEKSFIWKFLGKLGIGLSEEESKLQSAIKAADKHVSTLKMGDDYKAIYGENAEPLITETKKVLQESYDRANQAGFRILPQAEAKPFGLEGSFHETAYKTFIEDLDKFTKDADIPLGDRLTIEKEREKLKQAEKWSFDLSTTEMLRKSGSSGGIAPGDRRLNELCSEISEKIRELPVNESVLVPGGYRAHAVLYKITRDKDNSYSFEIYNTGTGYQKPGIKFANLSEEAVSSPKNLKDILNYVVGGKPDTVGMLTVNRRIERIFGEDKKVDGASYPHQLRGSCTFDCILAYVGGVLPPSIFKGFQLHMTVEGAKKVDQVCKAVIQGKEKVKGMVAETVKERAINFNASITQDANVQKFAKSIFKHFEASKAAIPIHSVQQLYIV